MIKREISICQQTRALLHKNMIKKWRMKRESLLEWLISLLLCLQLFLSGLFISNSQVSEGPPVDLGRIDKFNDSDFLIKYMPVTNTTQQIMDKMALTSFMKGINITGTTDEKAMASVHGIFDTMGIIFHDMFSYELKSWGYRVPHLNELHEHSAHCSEYSEEISCLLERYWKKGFVAFQAAINSAIIEIATNHSVMEQLMSVHGIKMKVLPFFSRFGFTNDLIILVYIISFSPMIYFVCLNVTRERKKIKKYMTIMGLQDSAFWLSWGLMYAVYIFILAHLLTVIIKSSELVVMTGYFTVFSLFFLYGLSLVALAFLLSVLIKKPLLTGLITFLLTVYWGGLGFLLLYQQLPAFLEWILSLLSPFAFIFGIIQIMRMDYNLRGFAFPDPSGDSHQLLAIVFMLIFDNLLYLALALYFEKILPREYGHQHSPLFFLRSSFWKSHPRAGHQTWENETNSTYYSDSFEPVPPEFHGKEAIRIRNLKKEYKGKPEKVEALKGLQLDIYEGQITAILGHSGAGKSTLINILSGLSAPTDGFASIYSNNLTETWDLEEIRRITGVCPQFNVHIDFLTVRENLRLYAKIKGVPSKLVEQEVQRVCLELEMKGIQDTFAANLSGGQKRKLTFGIAILGDPQVLLLDEPTAGLDPFSRHQVWHLLKEHKENRVILFSTQFMDEADLLADWKVFISSGRLKCAGSSLFLKKKWGIGYHLSLHRNESCDIERITSLIKHHIPDAKLTAESESKLVYTLPLERTALFPDLYNDLDNCTDQGIMNYGVSMTTLTEVFLKLEGKTATDEADVGSPGREQTEVTRHFENFVEPDQTFPSLPGEKMETVGGMALWRQQICAIGRVRFLKLKHDGKAVLSLFLLLAVTLIPIVLENILIQTFYHPVPWRFSPQMYFLSPGQQPQSPLSSLLIINNTGSNIEDFINSLKHQNIASEVDDFEKRNGTSDLAYNGAIIVSGKKEDYRFSLVCNTKRLNCFPVLMNIVSNGLLIMLNSSKQIYTEKSIFPFEVEPISMSNAEAHVFLILATTSLSPYFAMNSIIDYKIKAQALLRISGLSPSAYWCGQALVDIPLNFMILLVIYSIVYILNSGIHTVDTGILFIQIICIIGYAGSSVFLTYVISFFSKKGRKNSGIWSTFFFITSMFMFVFIQTSNSGLYAMLYCTAFIPFFTLFGCTMLISEVNYMYFQKSNMENGIYEINENILFVILIPYLHCIILLFVLRCLEMKYGKQSVRKDPLFRISPTNCDGGPNPEEPEEEDEDVQAERTRAARALTASNLDEKSVIIVSCLRKEYEGKKKSCFSKRKKKLATRNISFCVKKGEILGLLGHNGAGKSTCIRMITGETRPTAGKVVLKGSKTTSQQRDEMINILGYCAQENSVWPNLTVREHLEVYAAVKGLKKEDAVVTISRLKDALKLQEYMKVPVKDLPTGITRKLCFALSILENPTVILLDEPSTGMDPEGQQQIWRAIRAVFKKKDSGAILTTHYMAEAEAVCDRVAIMVSGQLRCIGSIQHLKSKFGKDYLLEIKVKEPGQVRHLHEEILKLFPTAARQERYSSLMVYKLPVEDVYPLSQAFSKLETAKHTFNLEEYSLSQSTLEQVFLELSKEQEMGNFEEELDTTIKWKLLPQEEP
ncbi:LOW QUALITY PROTEIN: ATP-binding cassette sub-family A member 10-like [Trichosurus vulpecula]|uniref:LOW QUALITY PROTEIN: ATP-binding cassette sub-family A member 10-like n=1 Tax=Trichosurus vulpecula TaxID=9337 RepID=UPI00186B56C1|nr:LOW QUALITY PROTEIN: ATP-binding cassette sub-family A member 10-like [Trichosurus vulpecula]